jgi:hypothetical protein
VIIRVFPWPPPRAIPLFKTFVPSVSFVVNPARITPGDPRDIHSLTI